ncbi:MAG: MBL fold metallo-hydrolase [Pseudomonadota bacterium]
MTKPCTPGELISLSPTLWRLTALNAGPMTGSGTNTYFFGCDAGVVVIDPGPNEARHREAITKLAPAPVIGVAVTHTHRDHSPAAMPLAASLGVPVFGMPPPATPENEHGFVPDTVLADGGTIFVPTLEPLRVVHTPGHASNHLCYLTPDGVLITGDHVMQGSTVVIMPPDGDMHDYLESLRRLLDLSLTAIAPGHGTLIDDPKNEIIGILQHRLARERKIATALQSAQPCSIDTLVRLAYDDVPSLVWPLARRSLEAHLVRLKRLGSVVQSDVGWREEAAGTLEAIVKGDQQ